ncbi:MAG: DHA2 family efflux MFS transporter permease subunit [Motiliproteus sp.]
MTRAADGTPSHRPSAVTFDSLFQRYGLAYRLFAIATIGVGAVATILSSTSINVAIPNIMGVFGIGQDVAQWLSAGYLAAATVTMLVTAWALAAFGIRTTFLVAMGVFIGASLMGALSPSVELLILSRVIQGAASGIFLPLSMVVMGRIFPPQKQGLAMGLFGILAVMAPAFGPYIGGILIDAFDWRYAFYLVLPMALISLPLAFIFLPGRESQGERPPLDWPGVLLLSACIGLLLLGLSKGQSKGWSSDYSLICFALVLASGGGFILRQHCCATPLLNLALFRHRGFVLAMLVTLVFGAGLYGSFYTTPLFLQTVQGLNATQAGFVLMPGGIVLAIVFPVSGHFSDRLAPRLLVSAGLLLFAYAFWVMVAADRNTGLWTFAWWIILGRIGLALIMPSLNVAALSPLPNALLTQGTGAINFFRQLGGALGVNLSAVYLERRTAVHTDAIASTQHLGHNQTWETLELMRQPLLSAGIDSLTQLPLSLWLLGREFFRQGLTLGFQDTFALSALIVLLALLPAWFLAPRVSRTVATAAIKPASK